MKQRLVMLALAAGCIVLAVAGALVYLGQDRKAPEITVEDTEISYTEGGDYEELLEGVTAEDNIDGDLTDQVFVDKIIQTGEDTGVVYYGVMDKHHNVGTARRTITYHLSEDGEEARLNRRRRQKKRKAKRKRLPARSRHADRAEGRGDASA